MDTMFWVWLGVIVVTAIVEFATMEMVSIWFTFGAIIPFIMSATNAVRWEVQIVVFVIVSAILIVSLRGITKKFLLRNANEKTNVDSLIGKQFRMIEKTDFETVGSVKINDIVWGAVGENQQTIETGEVVKIVRVEGNKLIVVKVSDERKTENEAIEKTGKEICENSEVKSENKNTKKKGDK